MADKLTHNGKQVISKEEAAQGWKILRRSKYFAFVQRGAEHIVYAVPTRERLTIRMQEISFEALDFLKFREGLIAPGEPWQAIMVLGGIHRIRIEKWGGDILLEKFPEVQWQGILGAYAEMFDHLSNELLKEIEE